MNLASTANPVQRATALLLCVLLCALCPAAYGDTDSTASDREPVGKVTGISASASQDRIPIVSNNVVRSNEVLTTNRSGRLRVQLDDGSILSLGSDTQFKVLKHDAASGDTVVNLAAGRLRSRVVKLRKSGTKFQVSTPQARITVVGTDFFLDVSPEQTQVVVYSGIVLVNAANGGSPLDVAAGQMTTVTRRGISRLTLTPEDFEQETMAETALPNEISPATSAAATENAPVQKTHSHLKRNVVIGAVIAAGAIAGAAAARGGGSSQTQTAPASQPSIPTIPPH